MNYYFLVASLPTLELDVPPDTDAETFKSLCAQHLSSRDYQALDALLAPEPQSNRHPFVRAWQAREIQLRNAVVKARAARLRRDAEPYLRETPSHDTAPERAVEDAFTKKTPLDREMALDRFRWQQVEELAGLNPFSSESVLSYALKFKLSTRWASIGREQGESKVEALVNTQPSDQQASE